MVSRTVCGGASIALALALTGGCGDSDTAEACSSGGVVLTGLVEELEFGAERQTFGTLEGVEVCVFDEDGSSKPCATSDDSGVFRLCGVPENENVLLSFQKKDHIPALRMMSTREADYDLLIETVLVKISDAENLAAGYGIDIEGVMGGAIQFFGATPTSGVLQVATLEGYRVALHDKDGDQAMCPGPDDEDIPCLPLYLDKTGNADETLTQSSRAGVGAFGNIAPGEYDLVFEHDDLDCGDKLPESGWKTSAERAVRVKVVDQFITSQVGVFCQPPE